MKATVYLVVKTDMVNNKLYLCFDEYTMSYWSKHMKHANIFFDYNSAVTCMRLNGGKVVEGKLEID